MPNQEQFDDFYHECDPDRFSKTPAEALANLERICGTLPEWFVRQFWERVEEWNATRASESSRAGL